MIVESSTLLSEFPLLMAHDAATSYLSLSGELAWWTAAQPRGGFGTLLDCGARALDVRTRIGRSGRVIMHHGPIEVDTDLSVALSDTIKWYESHMVKEVVVLYISHEGDPVSKVIKETESVFRNANISFFANCEEMKTLTVEKAVSLGGIIGLFNCVE